MKEIDGDLLDPRHRFEVIGHGVNVRATMGAGVAKGVRDLYPPAMFDRYAAACRDRSLTLGRVQPFVPTDPHLPVLLNMATQTDPGPYAERTAVWECVTKGLLYCWQNGYETLALPEIGCGIGGLEWESPDRAASPDPARYIGDMLDALDAASPVEIIVVHYDR